MLPIIHHEPFKGIIYVFITCVYLASRQNQILCLLNEWADEWSSYLGWHTNLIQWHLLGQTSPDFSYSCGTFTSSAVPAFQKWLTIFKCHWKEHSIAWCFKFRKWEALLWFVGSDLSILLRQKATCQSFTSLCTPDYTPIIQAIPSIGHCFHVKLTLIFNTYSKKYEY